MNRIITSIAVAFATLTIANAQEFKVGAKAGLLLSDLSTSNISIQTRGLDGLHLLTTKMR